MKLNNAHQTVKIGLVFSAEVKKQGSELDWK
jgi:hypothetical protein